MHPGDKSNEGMFCDTPPRKKLFPSNIMEDVPFAFGQVSSTPRRPVGLRLNDPPFLPNEMLPIEPIVCTIMNPTERSSQTNQTLGTHLYSAPAEDLSQTHPKQPDTTSTLYSSSSPPPAMSFSPPSDEYIGQTSSTVSTDFDMNRWPAIPIALDLRVNRCKRSVSPIPVSSEPVIHTAQISDTFGLQRPEFNVQQLLSATVQPIKPDSFGCIPTEQPPLLSDCKLIPSLPPLAPPPPTSLPFSTPTSTLSPDAALSLFQAMNALFQYLNQKSNNPAELLNHFPSQTEPVSFHPIQQLVKIESLQSPPIPTPPQPTFQRPMRSWPVDIGSRGYHPYKQQYHQHHHHPMRSHSHTPMDHCDRMVVRNASSCHPIPNITPITGRMKILGHDKGLPEHRPDKSSGHRFEPDRSVTDTTSSESGRSRLLSTDLSEEDAPGKGPIILYYPEPADSKNQIRAMLARNDPRLRYVNDGAAIRNPFAVDRKIQLTYLTNLLCIKTDDGGYLCKGCNRTTSRLRPMQQHLLSHSASKFNLCVRCLKGFNDKYDMKRHTRKHTLVRPYVCPECSRSFSQRCSLEGHRRKIHKVHLNYSRNQRREVVRVCESCGFACSSPVEMLRHTITFHPTSSSLPRLQRQLARMEERVRRSGLHSSIMRLHAPESSDPEAVPHRSMDERTEFETNCSSPNAIVQCSQSDSGVAQSLRFQGQLNSSIDESEEELEEEEEEYREREDEQGANKERLRESLIANETKEEPNDLERAMKDPRQASENFDRLESADSTHMKDRR